jgi:hypothetical protein
MSEQQTSEGQWPYAMWAAEPMPEELADALLDECSGDGDEAEAYAAYLREFGDRDGWYSANQIWTTANQAEVAFYSDWETVGDNWLHDQGSTDVIDTLMGVADDDEKTMLHHLVKQIGLKYGPRAEEWWYETGLLASGVVYCFKRP